MADIPSNLSYGTVNGRFLLAYADSNDSGQAPDAIPAQGTVYFTPSPNYIKDSSATPAPVTILPASVECQLDSDGYILGYAGQRGVRLLATDDPSGNPVNWTWKVEFRLTDASGTPVRTVPEFSFSLPSDSTIDLTDVMPVTSSNGTFYLVGPQGPRGETGPANTLTVGTVTTGEAGSSAEVLITGTSPNQTISFVIPRGDQGIQGIQGIQGVQGPVGPTGATGLNWQGEWSALVDYVNNDAVYYNSSSWFASGDPTVGEIPEIGAVHWMPLALQGAQGIQGIQGPQGIQGEQGPPGSLDNLNAVGPIVYNSSTSTLSFDATQLVQIDGGSA